MLIQNPSKTDPAGERGFEKCFVIDTYPDALSAGPSLWDMLNKDREVCQRVVTPLFRKDHTETEVTYEEARAALSREITAAVIDTAGHSPHSLRVGGSIAYANSPNGGELVAGYMGLWTSKAGDGYLRAGSQVLELAGWSIGLEVGDACVLRPGAVYIYAGRSKTNG